MRADLIWGVPRFKLHEKAKEERKEREEGMLSQDQKDCPISGVEWKRERERVQCL